jgi:hypothetical protein
MEDFMLCVIAATILALARMVYFFFEDVGEIPVTLKRITYSFKLLTMFQKFVVSASTAWFVGLVSWGVTQ